MRYKVYNLCYEPMLTNLATFKTQAKLFFSIPLVMNLGAIFQRPAPLNFEFYDCQKLKV